jgi:hypothetical protein
LYRFAFQHTHFEKRQPYKKGEKDELVTKREWLPPPHEAELEEKRGKVRCALGESGGVLKWRI